MKMVRLPALAPAAFTPRKYDWNEIFHVGRESFDDDSRSGLNQRK